MEPICPQCHVAVKATDFFCYNCGKNLHEKPLSLSPVTQAMYYTGSILLPPFGVIWGIKYLHQQNAIAKRVGIICIVLTIVSLIVTTIWSVNFFNSISSQVNSQLNGLQGF